MDNDFVFGVATKAFSLIFYVVMFLEKIYSPFPSINLCKVWGKVVVWG